MCHLHCMLLLNLLSKSFCVTFLSVCQVCIFIVSPVLCITGWSEGCNLDWCVPNSCDVCGPTGSHRGRGQSGRWHSGGVEKSSERQPHCWARVSLLYGISLILDLLYRVWIQTYSPDVQAEPWPSWAPHLLDVGSGWSLPNVGAVWSKPSPSAEIPQLSHWETGHHVSFTINKLCVWLQIALND